MSKADKEQVSYSRGHLQSHCGPTFHDDRYYCRHFIPGTAWHGRCDVVKGEIDPTFWCERYERVKKST